LQLFAETREKLSAWKGAGGLILFLALQFLSHLLRLRVFVFYVTIEGEGGHGGEGEGISLRGPTRRPSISFVSHFAYFAKGGGAHAGTRPSFRFIILRRGEGGHPRCHTQAHSARATDRPISRGIATVVSILGYTRPLCSYFHSAIFAVRHMCFRSGF
jgi:hypothetical protein